MHPSKGGVEVLADRASLMGHLARIQTVLMNYDKPALFRMCVLLVPVAINRS